MADELGTAVLRLELDTSGLKEALAKAKQQVEQELGTATTGTSRTRRTPPSTRVTTKGGARESTDAVERANQRIIGVQNRINVLEAKGVDISQARARLSQAITANSQRNFGTVRQVTSQLSNTLKIEEGRLRVSELQTAQLKRQAAAEKAATGTATQKGGAESITALTDAQKKRFRLEQQIRSLEIAGVNTTKLRAQLGEATTAQSRRQFGTFNQIADSLNFTLRKEREKLKVIRDQNTAIEKQVTEGKRLGRLNAQPVTGRTPTGPIPGSPAAVQAEARQQEKQAAEQRRLSAQRQREQLQEGLRIGALNATPVRGGAAFPGSPIALEKAGAAERKLTAQRERAAKATERAASAEKKQRAQDIQGRISSGLIGGAFPLMFGQGGGASIGGLLGGVAGGGPFGFGASLVGTLVGSQIDLLNQRFGDLAKALEDPLANFDAFVEKATLASKAQESLVKALQETGQTTAAAELIRTEASRTIDPIQAQGAVIAQDQFNRALSDTQDVLGAIVSGPATGFLTFLTGVLRTTKEAATQDPITASIKSQEKAANSIGRNVGGILAGVGLAAGGISSLIVTGGASAPVAAGLIGSGVSMAGIGFAGATSSNADLAVAQSSEVLGFELRIAEAKQRQLGLEKQILTATSQGKENLAQQLSVQAQFNALQIQEQQELSKIEQELDRNLANPFSGAFGPGAVEDIAKAGEQKKQLRLAIELRRDALLAAAAAAQTQSVKGLAEAKQLQGAYGDQRTILEEQLKIKKAIVAADEAQGQLNKLRRTPGADPKEIRAAEAGVNAAINTREIANIEGLDKIQRAQDSIALATFKEFQTREQISRSIGNTLQLLGTEQGQYRDTLGTIQQISDTIDAARRKEAQIGFQIDQARVGGRDEEAARLVDQQRTAALETRQRFVEGALALKEAGESVRANIISATQSLQNLKLSNLRFLSPGEQRETLNQLQRDFVAATQERGFTPRITGTSEQIIQEKQAFVDFTRQETQLTKAIDQGNLALIKINTRLSTQFESLVSTIPGLTEATTALVAKNWTVSLNVVNNADGSKTINSINSLS